MKHVGFKKWAFMVLGTLFLISSFLPGFNEQLNKLPSLVNHYRHHLAEEGFITVADFIDMHYSEGSLHKGEEDHQDLPLYQNSVNVLHVLVEELPVYNIETPIVGEHEHACFKHAFYSFNNPSGIFQPPRAS